MKRFTLLVASLAVVAAVGAGVGSTSTASCTPTALEPATSQGYAAARGQTSGCTGDTYHFHLYLVSGDVTLRQVVGTTSGNQHGQGPAAFCHGHEVQSVLSITVNGVVVKKSVSESVDC